ncbi:MAG TPA: SH3 domain-containing protein [Rhizomicrobium sp.]|nr:SH3 domain-containing protein [Rhizomicrobium sp.]
MSFVIRRFAPLLIFCVLATPCFAGHYVSLKSDKVFLREGPTYKHRVLFTYQRKGYPLQVLAVYDSWRRVRDVDGTTGWVSQTMLSDLRSVLITGKGRAALRSAPYATAPPLANAEPGVVARLKACKPRFCEIAVDGVTGWIDRTRIWGVDPGEIIN